MTFVPNTLENTTYSSAREMKKQGDWMYVGGHFTSFAGEAGFTGLCRYSVTTGLVDTTWKPALGLTGSQTGVTRFEFSSDGSKIYILLNLAAASMRAVNVSDASVTTIASTITGGTLNKAAIQVDATHIYLSGTFTAVTPNGGSSTARNYICRFKVSDNTLDSWYPTFNGSVNDIKLDSSYVYAAGAFTTVGGVTHSRLVKLNKSDGLVASDWNANSNTGAEIRSLLIGSDNNLYMWGPTSWNGTALSGAGYLVKCSKTGVRDTNFSSGTATAPTLTDTIRLWEVSGSLYITWMGLNTGFGQVRKGIFKVSMATRAVDETFDTVTSGLTVVNSSTTRFAITSLAYDGEMLHLGCERPMKYKGARLLIHPVNPATAALVPMRATNQYATPELIGFTGDGQTVESQLVNGGYTYVIGNFAQFDGIAGFKGVARYNTLTGAVDTNWKPQGPSAAASCAVIHPDGLSIYVGYSTGVRRFLLSNASEVTVPTMTSNTVAKMVLDGTTLWIGAGFTDISNSPVQSGGAGLSVATTSRFPLVKLDTATGLLDVTYSQNLQANFNTSQLVNDIAVDSTGVYLAVNGTAAVNGVSNTGRLFKVKKSIGSGENPIASSWQGNAGLSFSGAANNVSCILAASNGSIYIGGYWAGYNGTNLTTSQGQRVLKLDSDGARDTNWTTTTTLGTVNRLIEHNGSLYAGYAAYGSIVNTSTLAVVKSQGLSSFTQDNSFSSPTGLTSGGNTRSLLVNNSRLLVGLDLASDSIGGVLSSSVALDQSTGAISNLSAVDSAPPSVALSSSDVSNGGTTSLGSITMSATFSEVVTGFTVADVTVSGGSAGSFSGSGSSYTFTVTPYGQGAVSVSIGSGVCQDGYGNQNQASSSYAFTYDSQAPTVVLSAVNAATNAAVATGSVIAQIALAVSVSFSEAVTGVAQGDFAVSGGTISNFSVGSGGGTFTLTPSADGVMTVKMTSGSCQDSAGNGNSESNTLSFTVQTVPVESPVMSLPSQSVAKKAILAVTISKSAVAGKTSIPQNAWKRVLLVYKATGKPNVVMSFNTSQATPASRFRANINTSASYQIQQMIVMKADGKAEIIQRAALSSPTQYDISVT